MSTSGGVDLSHLIGGQHAQPGAEPGAAHHTSTAASVSPVAGAAAAPSSAPTEQVVDVPSLVFDITDDTIEQALQLSQVVPVVIDLWAEWCGPCTQLSPVIEAVTREFGGRLVLGKVDVDRNPRLQAAFQVQSIPAVVALLGGRPVPLFQGAQPEAQVRQVFEQLLELAPTQGVTGRANALDTDSDAAAAASPVNPEHEAALAALEAGDLDTAVSEYEAVLKRAPGDDEARAALAQVKLLQRLQAGSADEIRAAAADAPDDVEAQLRAADLDISGGHIEDAYLRVLDLFARADGDDRTVVQERLLELFEVVGTSDPRTVAARRRFTSLLFS